MKILEVDSISKGKDLTPYWKESCLEMSKRLLSATETGYVDLDLNSSITLQQRTTANSWFSITHNSHLKKNLSETLFPSSMYSHVEFTDSGNTLAKSKKIRIYPKNEDIIRFKKYFGLTRYWFNKTVDYLKNPETKANFFEVRSIIQKQDHPEWAFDSPQRIREHAIKDAVEAVKNAKMKSKKTNKFQEVHFRSRKEPKQRFGFDKISINNEKCFGKNNQVRFYSTEDINVDLEGTEIVRESGRYFVIIPVKSSIKIPENQRLGAVALDPGVRTFQTYYSQYSHGKIGSNDFARIFRLCYRLDSIQSKMATADGRSRRRLKKAAERIRWKIKDLIGEIHHKTANFLVKNFDVIYLPTFETSQMVTKLHSKVARSMLTWAHYRFKQFLKFKAKEYSSSVVDVNEAYTSKTCSYCGNIQNIGSKKIMKCKHCGISVDRDLNGARGIFLKNSGALTVTSDSSL